MLKYTKDSEASFNCAYENTQRSNICIATSGPSLLFLGFIPMIHTVYIELKKLLGLKAKCPQ